MTEVDVKIGSVFNILNNTVLYTNWFKDGVYSDDIFDIVGASEGQLISDEDIIPFREGSLIELKFNVDPKITLVMMRQSLVQTEEGTRCKITLETMNTEWNCCSPKNIKGKIIITCEKLSSFRTKIETSFLVDQETGFWESNVSETLSNILAESMPKIPTLGYENVLRDNLAHFAMLQKNSITKHQFKGLVKKQKDASKDSKNMEGLKNGKQNEIQGESKNIEVKSEEISHSVDKQNAVLSNNSNGVNKQLITIEEEKEEAKEPFNPELQEQEYDRDLGCVDGHWLKWITDRLDSEEKLEQYNELKRRIHEENDMPNVTESCMLRFFHGMEYDVEKAEKQIVKHINHMNENELWDVAPSKMPNFVNSNILVVYKEDIYQRPVGYLRIAKFYPSEENFEEALNYGFWNAMNMRRAFRPHVESHLAIYDVKGISRK